ncbi:MAG: hypothetical protein OD816_000147 [Thermodesulfobacterium sp.]|uniref:Uncharacterized protein n=1 Tax=Candidatus Thermodesulfobacterium syntrophicum TaxID=3060442 RepID=A0AAE3TEE3_9BACT|nr:hypothetical protein [Candidatus Thermodesulfobacterium syntrophicum]
MIFRKFICFDLSSEYSLLFKNFFKIFLLSSPTIFNILYNFYLHKIFSYFHPKVVSIILCKTLRIPLEEHFLNLFSRFKKPIQYLVIPFFHLIPLSVNKQTFSQIQQKEFMILNYPLSLNLSNPFKTSSSVEG